MYLEQIAAAKRAEWAGRAGRMRTATPPARRQAGRFATAISGPDVAVIAEIKPTSPSKGRLISLDAAGPMARLYSAGGARAISVIADTAFFGGSPELVAAVAADPQVDVPVLYKDFLVDLRQVQLAHACAADAVLVIVRLVDDSLLRDILDMAAELGLDALVETFTEGDVERALQSGARIVGVNNRDLQTFAVDLENSARLRRLIPDGVLTVSESGLDSRAAVNRIAGHGFHAALVGETLLTSPDPARQLRDLTGAKIAELTR